MSTFRRWTIIPAVTLALTMTACGSDDDTASTSPAAASSTAETTASTSVGDSTPATESPIATLPAEPVSTDTVDDSAADVVITVTVGVDSSPDRIEEIPIGSTVQLTVVDPNKDDEFHVHGFDLGDGVEMKAGEPEVFTFTATADKAGVWEVESHSTDEVLLQLKVN